MFSAHVNNCLLTWVAIARARRKNSVKKDSAKKVGVAEELGDLPITSEEVTNVQSDRDEGSLEKDDVPEGEKKLDNLKSLEH